VQMHTIFWLLLLVSEVYNDYLDRFITIHSSTAARDFAAQALPTVGVTPARLRD